MNDSLAVLENGEKALENTLLIQARVNFQPTHEQQPELTLISHWAARHGFSFYRLNNEAHISHLPKRDDLIERQATQLASADAIYIPNAERIAALDNNQRIKLAFMLHTVYGVKDLAYELINAANEKHSETYLVEEGYLPRNKKKTKVNSLELTTPNRSLDNPEVSIICATYNHKDFIEDAIKGFLEQETSFTFEIIIHDDASTDGTREIVERYAYKYPNLIKAILQEENQYSQKRRPLDIVLPATRGKYIALCEGDDYWTDPKKLQKQYDFLEENTDHACCYHNAFVFNKTGIISDSKLPEKFKKDASQQDLLLNNCFILTLSLFFKKQFLQFPEEKGSVANGDNFLISMLGLYGKGKYMPEIEPAAYRIHPNSTWSSKNQEQKKAMLNNTFHWIAKYHERSGRKNIADFYYKKASALNQREVKTSIENRTKYFCIGRNKTGTTSLKQAFQDLGFKVGNQRTAEELADKYYFDGNFDPIIEYCQAAHVFQDVPFSYPETFKHLDAAYPGSKFILTIRDNPEQWYRSITQFHAKKFGRGNIPTVHDLKEANYIRKGFMYNTVRLHKTPDNDPYNKEILIKHYEDHNRMIIEYFKDRPNDLLVINLKAPNAYQKFLAFIGLESPYENFPWVNKT